MNLKISNERLRALVDVSANVVQLATGFHFVEGPIWIADEEYLLFSDIPRNARIRWDMSDGARVVASPTNKANGMTIDAGCNLVVCEHATSALVQMDLDGTGAGRKVLASHHQGRALNSPNDVVVRSDQSIYFTDPMGGRQNDLVGLSRPQELNFQGVFRLGIEGDLSAVAQDFEVPNGLCFSPDGSKLYVNDTRREHIRVFAVQEDGSLSGGRVFADQIGTAAPRDGLVDGMKCDELGNVWVTGPLGIWIFDPAGVHLGVIGVPEVAANLHWGGPEWNWLFITATSSLYRIRAKVSGAREPFMG